MKRFMALFTIMCATIMLLCCSCSLLIKQEFVCNVEEVKTIQIVTLDEYIKEEYRFEYTVLAEVSDHSYFIDRLKSIKTSFMWGEPFVLEIGFTAIRIEYLNGDYALIQSYVQSKKGAMRNFQEE